MRFMNIDSPFMQFLGKIADMMWLNILALVCCLPIVTAGASLTALHYMALKIVRNEECYISRGFFRSFKENFKQATAIWLILLVVALVLTGDFLIMQSSGLEFNMVIQVILVVVAVMVLMTFTCVFPMLARFDNTLFNTFKNALFMSILQLPKTIAMIILAFVLPVLSIFFPQMMPIVFLFGLSAPAVLSAMMYNKFFKKLEAQIQEAAIARGEGPVEEENEEDKIFRDHVEEGLE